VGVLIEGVWHSQSATKGGQMKKKGVGKARGARKRIRGEGIQRSTEVCPIYFEPFPVKKTSVTTEVGSHRGKKKLTGKRAERREQNSGGFCSAHESGITKKSAGKK